MPKIDHQTTRGLKSTSRGPDLTRIYINGFVHPIEDRRFHGQITGTNFGKSVDFWLYFGPKTSNIASKVLKPILKSFPLHARHLRKPINSKQFALTWSKVPKGKYARPSNHPPNRAPN